MVRRHPRPTPWLRARQVRQSDRWRLTGGRSRPRSWPVAPSRRWYGKHRHGPVVHREALAAESTHRRAARARTPGDVVTIESCMEFGLRRSTAGTVARRCKAPQPAARFACIASGPPLWRPRRLQRLHGAIGAALKESTAGVRWAENVRCGAVSVVCEPGHTCVAIDGPIFSDCGDPDPPEQGRDGARQGRLVQLRPVRPAVPHPDQRNRRARALRPEPVEVLRSCADGARAGGVRPGMSRERAATTCTARGSGRPIFRRCARTAAPG